MLFLVILSGLDCGDWISLFGFLSVTKQRYMCTFKSEDWEAEVDLPKLLTVEQERRES